MKHLLNDDQASVQEQWSALHDGQLSASQARALVQASLDDPRLLEQWRSMSTISDVLRTQQGAVGLALPQVSVPVPATPLAQPSANDGVFRWKMVAGVAAMAAVGSLVWGLLGAGGGALTAPQGVLAQAAGQAQEPARNGLVAVSAGQIAGQEATMIRNPHLDDLLAAHKQFGGASALHQSTGALRSVSVTVQRP
jgi:sigma-E factor negative regulatory protein RseA